MKKHTLTNKVNHRGLTSVITRKIIPLLLTVTVLFVLVRVSAAEASVSFEALPENTVYNDFVVGPGKIDIELAPGQSKTFELTIANRLGTEKTFTISEEDFIGSNDPKQTVILLGDDRGPYSLKDYVTLGTTTFDISHATKSRVSVIVSIPPNAQPGGLYGSVVVGTATKGNDVANASGVNTTNPIITRIGTLIFVRVSGAAQESGKLTSITLAGNRFVLSDPSSVVFDLLFKNDGNVHLNPRGTITVSNLLGSNVGNIDVEPWFAMPNSLRFREVEWKPNFLFGRYVAKATIDRGYDNVKDEMSVTFWVIPWKIILSIFIALILFIGLVGWLMKKFKIARR